MSQDLLRKWKYHRITYPGWFAAPGQARSKLWNSTERDLREFFVTFGKLSLPWRIEYAHELAYRLQFINVEILPEMEKALEELLDVNVSEIPNLSEKEIMNLQQKTEDLKITLLKHYTFTFQTDKANNLRDKLHSMDVQTDIEWCSTIQKLLSLDLDSVHSRLLEKSPTNELKDLFRQGALLMEFDTGSMPLDLLMELLDRSRQATKDDNDYLYRCSLEGWIMFLLRMSIKGNELKGQRSSLEPEQAIPEYRWEQLSKLQANPFELIQWFDGKLAPRQKDTDYRFEIGSGEPLTYRFGGDNWSTKHVNSLSLVQFILDSGIPLHYDLFVTIKESLIYAAYDLGDTYPMLSLSFLVRIGDNKALNNWLTRERIDEWDTPNIDQSVELLSNGIRQLYNKKGYPKVHRMYVLPCALEALSRLYFKMDDRHVAEVLQLALEAYHSEEVYSHHVYHKGMRNLLKRIFSRATSRDLEQVVNILFNDKSFRPSKDWTWPQLLNLIPTRLLAELKTPEVPAAADKLILLTFSTNDDQRNVALSALGELAVSDNLSSNNKKQLAENLWKNRDPDTDLPTNHPFLPHVFLHLPAPEGIDVRKRLVDYIVNTKVDSPVKQVVESDGSVKVSIGGESNYLISIRNLIVDPYNKKEYVLKLTSGENEILAEKLLNNLEEVLPHARTGGDFPIADPWITSHIRLLNFVLANQVLPFVQTNHPVFKKLNSSLQSLAQKNLPYRELAILSLCLDRSEADWNINVLNTDLLSLDDDVFQDAVRATVLGLLLHSIQKLKRPDEAVKRLLDRFVHRHQNLKLVVLHELHNIGKIQAFTTIEIEYLLEGMNHLLSDIKSQVHLSSDQLAKLIQLGYIGRELRMLPGLSDDGKSLLDAFKEEVSNRGPPEVEIPWEDT